MMLYFEASERNTFLLAFAPTNTRLDESPQIFLRAPTSTSASGRGPSVAPRYVVFMFAAMSLGIVGVPKAINVCDTLSARLLSYISLSTLSDGPSEMHY